MATDREVLLYRSKRSGSLIVGAVVIVLLVSGFILATMGETGYGVVITAYGVFLFGGLRGLAKDGYCRRAYSELLPDGYTYPPLDEWEEDLKRRGAIPSTPEEVNYGD